MIKVGDIIDGKKVTKVYDLCGGVAYQSEPIEIGMNPPEETVSPEEKEEKPKRGRRRKEV